MQPGPQGAEMYVSFQIKAPASGIVTYAVADAVPAESQINELNVYVFGPDDHASDADKTEGNTDAYVLQEEYRFSEADLAFDGSVYTVSGMKVNGENVKHFYFIANRRWNSTPGTKETSILNAGVGGVSTTATSNQPYISLTGWSRDDSYVLTPDQSGKVMTISGLPMSAYAEVDFTTGAPATAPGIAPLRSVARVDVYNKTTNYTIKGITIRSRDNGYHFPSEFDAAGAYVNYLYPGMAALVYPSATGPDPRIGNAGYAGTRNFYGFIEAPAGGLAPSSDPDPKANPTKWLGAGYMYESPAHGTGGLDGATIIVEVEHDVTGQVRALEFLFHDGTDYIAVKRNNVYTLNILETLSNDLHLGYTVTDWKDAAELEIKINATPKAVFAVGAATDIPTGASMSTATTGTMNTTLTAIKGVASYKIIVSASGVPVEFAYASDFTENAWIKNPLLTEIDAVNHIYEFTFNLEENMWPVAKSADIGFRAVCETSPVSHLIISQNFN